MQELNQGDPRLKAWPVLGIAFIQSILLFAHWLLYRTAISFCGNPGPATALFLRASLLTVSVSFVVATLVGFYFSNALVTGLYRAAAIWMGFLNFLFFGAVFCWLAWAALRMARFDSDPARLRPLLGFGVLGIAIAMAVYGMINAYAVRVRRIAVSLPNLPPSWRGRTAVVVSDLHLGHINALGFSRRIVSLITRLNPDVVFIAGDIFDGVKVDPERLAAPFKQLSPRFGVYFATGNHDEFGDTRSFLAALEGAGIRVLNNEKVLVDGLQIIGAPYHDTTLPIRFRASLESLHIDRSSASILINHVPNRLPIVEEAGISLQLSGHTHGGQFIPFTWLTHRIFGPFTYGLHRFGALQVYTSYGAGTWGPPMRVGTSPEVVLLTFEDG
jgi:uncharacterized protein